jgi:glycosyltransferase involved in cell wall biosynthesis
MVEHGMILDIFTYVPNGIDGSGWGNQNLPIPDKHRQYIATMRIDGLSLLGYIGTYGLANALDTLLDAVLLLCDTPVIFVLVGNGPEKRDWKHVA